MNPSWIVVVVGVDGVTTVEELKDEEASRVAFNAATAKPYRTAYRAPVRAKATNES